MAALTSQDLLIAPLDHDQFCDCQRDALSLALLAPLELVVVRVTLTGVHLGSVAAKSPRVNEENSTVLAREAFLSIFFS